MKAKKGLMYRALCLKGRLEGRGLRIGRTYEVCPSTHNGWRVEMTCLDGTTYLNSYSKDHFLILGISNETIIRS